MGREQVRILGLAAASIVLLLVTSFAMDWFTVDQSGVKIGISLSGMHACSGGVCHGHGLPKDAGLYTSTASSTLWGSVAFAVVVGALAVMSVFAGATHKKFTKIGCLFGVSMLGTSFFSGYLFAPDGVGEDVIAKAFQTGLVIQRTWAPLLQILGHALGVAAVYYAGSPGGGNTDGVGEYKPIVLGADAPKARPLVAGPVVASPAAAKGRLRHAAANAEVSRAGVDARLEDGTAVMIAWRDLTSAGASKLPAREPYGGAVFVELVSSAGETIRVLPWTRLTGEQLPGEGEIRARGLLRFAAAQNATTKVDAGTRGFLSGREPAAYDPD